MIDLRRILCPVDFSEISRRALDHAAALGRRHEATVLALHVVPLATPLPMAPAPVYPAATMPPDPRARRSMLEELEHAVAPVRRLGVNVETLVREGDAVHAILHETEQLPIDLVVMGSHGAGGFEHLVMGSVAEKVLRKAPCPVLTVGPPTGGDDAARGVRYDRILCPIDFSEPSIRALEYALSLAEGPSCRVTLFHVHEQILYSFLPYERALEDAHYVRAVLDEIQEHLERMLPDNASDLCTPRVVARRGRPHEEILRLAREEESDVIVLGVHGRPFLERLLLGSVTSHVVRGAPCPVLTVRATTRDPVPVEAGAAEEKGAT
jgi:nucleotide-binding universal stress UspA family protein